MLSISISLVAVFIPLLFLGGILGRLFHEFATTLTMAIAISAIVSLTLTPMVCAHFMRADVGPRRRTFWSRIDGAVERAFERSVAFYAVTLGWALRRRFLMVGATLGAVVLTVAMYVLLPKSMLPTQDTGLIQGGTIADPSVSFAAMVERQRAVVDVLLRDPAIAAVGSQVGVANGFNALNRGTLTVSLKPLAERGLSSEQVIVRLRPALTAIGGVQTFLYSAQDLRAGGRQGGSNQYVLLDQDLGELREWTQRLEDRLRTVEGITDVSSDQDRAGPQATLVIDRLTAARLGVSMAAIDNALNNAFSQRQSSIIYTDRNQYRVVLEIDPRAASRPVLSRPRLCGGNDVVAGHHQHHRVRQRHVGQHGHTHARRDRQHCRDHDGRIERGGIKRRRHCPYGNDSHNIGCCNQCVRRHVALHRGFHRYWQRARRQAGAAGQHRAL